MHHMDKVVIVETEGNPDAAEDGLVTRVVTREGRTYVFKTSEPLSDAEVERRVAEAEGNLPPVPPFPGEAPHRIEKRIVVREGDSRTRIDVADCAGRAAADVSSSGEADGTHTRVNIRVCGDEGGNSADALAAVRKARADVAADTGIPDAVRADVLGKLDAEIARLERTPG